MHFTTHITIRCVSAGGSGKEYAVQWHSTVLYTCIQANFIIFVVLLTVVL